MQRRLPSPSRPTWAGDLRDACLDRLSPQVVEFLDGADVQQAGVGIEIPGDEYLLALERPGQTGGVKRVQVAVKLAQREAASMPNYRAAETGQGRALRHDRGGGWGN